MFFYSITGICELWVVLLDRWSGTHCSFAQWLIQTPPYWSTDAEHYLPSDWRGRTASIKILMTALTNLSFTITAKSYNSYRLIL